MGVYRSSEHMSQTNITTGDKSGYYSNKQHLVRVYYYLNTSHGINKDNLLTIEGFFSRRSFPKLKGDTLRGNFVDDRSRPLKIIIRQKTLLARKYLFLIGIIENFESMKIILSQKRLFFTLIDI